MVESTSPAAFGTAIKPAGNLLFQHAFLMAKSALKNKEMSQEFAKKITEGLEQWDNVATKETDNSKKFKIIVGLMVLRDYIKKTFHNGVCYSVLNGNHDIKSLASAGRSVFAHLPNKDVWDQLEKVANA